MTRGPAPPGPGSPPLTRRDLARLIDFVENLYATHDLNSFRAHVVSALQHLIPSEINAYNEVNLRTQHNTVVYDRPEAMSLPNGDEIFDHHIQEHPLIAISQKRRGHGAIKISDVLSTARFHRTGLYNEFFARIGIEDQMVISFPSPRPVVVGIALNRRKRNFTERDRLLLNLARPHLLQAWRNAEAWTRVNGELILLRKALEHSGTALIELAKAGRVRTMTPTAEALLAKYFPGTVLLHDSLPETVKQWISQQQAALTDSADVLKQRDPLVLKGDGRRLVIRMYSDESGTVLLLDEPVTMDDLEITGLTLREKEVLKWVARGKTNNEIASILGASPRTVQKHLEHTFQKIGVRTRTAAALAVRDVWPDRSVVQFNHDNSPP